jgi:hypothetical protein
MRDNYLGPDADDFLDMVSEKRISLSDLAEHLPVATWNLSQLAAVLARHT